MEKPHSRIGIASCVLAAGMFVSFVVAIVAYNLQVGEAQIGLPEGLVLLDTVVLMFLPIPVHAVGLVLGAIGLFQPSRRKVYPVAGVVSNLVFGLGSLFPWLYLAFHSLGRVQ